ncbi:hypothetical protein CHS0354_042972 [Potamilus streckersoni]|uniref:Uncharacterized protein n=1 Tax=Potamilus streckersoni TaxID=2493646 RepID=A0AAE0T3K5_9BIVA|nr:hypothetical protein CHS0354_042972 [Potamilus streckersoni]
METPYETNIHHLPVHETDLTRNYTSVVFNSSVAGLGPCELPTVNTSLVGEEFCEPIFDGLLCWPATSVAKNASQLCPVVTIGVVPYAHRACLENGSWASKSDYSECLYALNPPSSTPSNLGDLEMVRLAEILRDIYFILSIVSLFLLVITIFIFSYFRSLQCSRISIHKHLVVSFILRFIIIIIVVGPYISQRRYSMYDGPTYRDIDWLCKIITTLSQYTTLANIFWMFVEGLFLHNQLVVAVFTTEAPFKLFYSIGWGMPALITVSWSLVLHFYHDSPCWQDYSQTQYAWIITAPYIIALAINLVFLVNIIRVLVSKLRANNRIESTNMRKAIKATIILLPLLGITNLLFFWNPADNRRAKTAYYITNAVLHSSQGIFVSILYCFLNGEVRRVLRQKWYRFKISHLNYQASGRRRSSRTSSCFLSQTEDAEHTSSDRPAHNVTSQNSRPFQATTENTQNSDMIDNTNTSSACDEDEITRDSDLRFLKPTIHFEEEINGSPYVLSDSTIMKERSEEEEDENVGRIQTEDVPLLQVNLCAKSSDERFVDKMEWYETENKISVLFVNKKPEMNENRPDCENIPLQTVGEVDVNITDQKNIRMSRDSTLPNNNNKTCERCNVNLVNADSATPCNNKIIVRNTMLSNDTKPDIRNSYLYEENLDHFFANEERESFI